MGMRLLLILLLLASAIAIAPLETCNGDKVPGSYIVRFGNRRGPDTKNLDSVKDWNGRSNGGQNVKDAWSIGDDNNGFRGYGADFTPGQLNAVRGQPDVEAVSEDCVVLVPEVAGGFWGDGFWGDGVFKMEGGIWSDGVFRKDRDAVIPAGSTGSAAYLVLPGWGQARSDQYTADWDLDISFTPPADGSAAVAWVFDTGVNANHQEFAVNRATNAKSFIKGQNTDGNGHGTHVAGTIIGARSGNPSAGYVKAGTVKAVKVLSNTGSGSNSGIISAIDYVLKNRVANKLNVISMSLSGPLSTALNAAVDKAVDAGIPVVVAAGNENVNAQNLSPCSAAKAICVAAINPQNKFASFSNFGDVVDIAAPGVDILSAYYVGTNYYAFANGTSMATPAVTAQVMILGQLLGKKTFTYDELKTAIANFGTKDVIADYGAPKTIGGGNVIVYDEWALPPAPPAQPPTP